MISLVDFKWRNHNLVRGLQPQGDVKTQGTNCIRPRSRRTTMYNRGEDLVTSGEMFSQVSSLCAKISSSGFRLIFSVHDFSSNSCFQATPPIAIHWITGCFHHESRSPWGSRSLTGMFVFFDSYLPTPLHKLPRLAWRADLDGILTEEAEHSSSAVAGLCLGPDPSRATTSASN